MKTETVSIPAVLNDSVAAKDFQKRLPVTVSGSRGEYDYHFKTAIGCFDPEQTQIGWQDGNISLSGGWLRIFFSGEEETERRERTMVIAHIDRKDLLLVRALPENAKIRVEIADDEEKTGR